METLKAQRLRIIFSAQNKGEIQIHHSPSSGGVTTPYFYSILTFFNFWKSDVDFQILVSEHRIVYVWMVVDRWDNFDQDSNETTSDWNDKI